MPVQKSPQADLRRRYPLYAEVGLALALGAAVLAFTMPAPPSEAASYAAPDTTPISLQDIPQTFDAPPPPPPPAPPPPVEVDDADKVLEDIVTSLDVPLDAYVAPPSGRPAPPPSDPIATMPPPVPTLPAEDIDPEQVFDVVETQPVLIGGIEDLQARVEYPELAARVGVSGRVVVQFVVDERGAVVDPVVIQSPSPLLSEAALAAVRESRFTPGQQRGRPVKVRFTVPVFFRLH